MCDAAGGSGLRERVALKAKASYVAGFPVPLPLRVERKTFWGVFGKCVGRNLSV